MVGIPWRREGSHWVWHWESAVPCSFQNVHSLVDTIKSKLFNCVLSSLQHVLHQLLPLVKILVTIYSKHSHQRTIAWFALQLTIILLRRIFTECYVRMFTRGLCMRWIGLYHCCICILFFCNCMQVVVMGCVCQYWMKKLLTYLLTYLLKILMDLFMKR